MLDKVHSYIDRSNRAGFSFIFNCEQCGKKYFSRFIRFTGYDSDRIPGRIACSVFRLMSHVAKGRKETFDNSRNPTPSSSTIGMTGAWNREHDFILKNSLTQVMLTSLNRCQECMRYVCDYCFVVDNDKCVDCSMHQKDSRMGTEDTVKFDM